LCKFRNKNYISYQFSAYFLLLKIALISTIVADVNLDSMLLSASEMSSSLTITTTVPPNPITSTTTSLLQIVPSPTIMKDEMHTQIGGISPEYGQKMLTTDIDEYLLQIPIDRR
jgi:hypothetical protein